jgi:subtilase family serine protease
MPVASLLHAAAGVSFVSIVCLLFVVFLCFFNCCGSKVLLRLTAFAAALCACLPVMHAQEARLQVIQHHVRQQVADHRAAFMGRLSDDAQLHLSVVLPLRNQAALTSLLQRLYDPSSPDYRHFLSVAQFTEQFGPTEGDYAAVASYLQSYGLTIENAPANRLIVPVSGSVMQVNAAFNVQMNTYQHPTEDRTFFSPDREPSLRLNVPIKHITGLDNFSLPQHFAHRSATSQSVVTVNGSGPGGSYLGSDMRAAYYGGTTLDGTGQAVGLLEFGGYDMTDVTLTFSNAGQTNNVPINNVLLDGASGGPLGSDGEQVLDIVQAIGMAPGLSQVRVYIGVPVDDAHILNAMVSENIAKQISCSWGWLPVDPTTDDVFFQEMAAQGQSFFAASGDSGAFDSAISPFFYPGEDQYVTAVGGTHLTTTGPGGTWVSETVWNTGGGSSGGGISPDGITLPSYQNGLANSVNGGSTTLRNVPDVAMEGDFDNYACQAHSCNGGWAGTSFAAPRWAGFMALINQQAVEAGTAPAGGIGFLNPTLYQLAQGANAANDLHDIVSGNNRTANQPVWFSAVAGYDLTTGWGSANGQSLIDDLAGPQIPGFWLTSSQSAVDVNPGGTGATTIKITDAGGFTGAVNLAVTSTLPNGIVAAFASNPVTTSNVLTFSVDSSVAQQNVPVTVTGTAGSLTQATNLILSIHTPTFALLASSIGLTINPGRTVNATITVVPKYGFTGSVNLAIAGLPSGVTASFSPISTTGTSTLTLTASSSATASNSILTITGTSGNLTAATTLGLSIIGPKFVLIAGSPVSVGQGSSVSTFVNVLAQNGFSGSVTLAATNLPAGVTATFSTNPTTYVSTVTFTASSTAPVGQSTVTITGVSGALTSSALITLNVKQPTFTLGTASSLSLGQGSSTSTYVSVNGLYGFNGSVALSVSGLPNGVTALWGPNPTTSSTTLYLYATNSVTPGSYPLTITGTSGTSTATAPLTMTVAVPSFTMSSLGTLTMGPNSSNYAYVNIQRLYGFSGSVSLSASGLPSGVTASFSPNPVTGTYYGSSLTLQTSASVVPGQYSVTVTGVSGSQTVTVPLTLIISAPTFTLYGGGSLTIGQGLSGTTSVYINRLYGFTGNVNFSVSGLPGGVTASFSPNPATSTYSTLTLTAAGTVPVGLYPLTITGTSGSITQTTTLTLTVGTPSFTLLSYGLTVGQGQTSSGAVYVNTVNGFTGAVNLAVSGLPTGVTASFLTNPTTSYYNQLTFNVSSSVPVGQYPLTITGTSGSLTQTTTLTLTVGAPSFTLSAASYQTIGQGSTGTGYVYVQPQNGFSGSVSLSISGLPSGVTAAFSTNPTTYSSSILFTVASTAAVGASTLTITGTSGTQTQTTTMTLTVAAPTFTLYGPYSVSLNQGASANSSVTVTPQYGFTGNVSLSASGLPSGVTASFSPNPATGASTMTLSATSTASPGTVTFTIVGTSGSITTSVQAQVVVNAGNFSLTAAPGEVFVSPGASGKSTINVVPINGFTNTVSLSASGLPAGVTAAFSPATATTSSILTLTAASSASAGSSTLTISGSSGAQTASTPLRLIITGGAGANTSTTLSFAIIGSGTSGTTMPQGTLVIVKAGVTAGSTPVTAGQVFLCDANTPYCDSIHQIATSQLDSSGNALFRFVPGIGVHTYKAVFAGTSGYMGSNSVPGQLTVTASLSTTTTLTSSGTPGNYSLTATVIGQGAVAPSGNVSFIDTTMGNAVLASTATVSNSATITENIVQTIPTGTYPVAMVSDDFNKDGIPDLAVANMGSSTVSILLGNGKGTFSAGTALQTGTASAAIAVGDFNRDGNVDLAVTIPTSATVAIFYGNGDGTFTAGTTPVYTPPQPSGIVVADVNGDGLQDLTVLSKGSGSVTILLGHGDGTFTPANFSPATGNSPQSIVQADFNGDGITDLAITNYSYTASVTILMGNGDGSFTAAPPLSTTANPYSIAVGDFNQDGKPDLAIGANGGGAVNVFLGKGDGTFVAAANALTTSYALSLAIGDINGDKKPDLIVADANSYKLTTLLGNGDGTFTTGATNTVTAQPEAVVVGDWNNDGVPDIAAVNYYGSSVTALTTQLAQKTIATVNNISPNGIGQHAIKASYPGDTSYTGSTSTSVNLLVNQATPTITWATPAAITYGTGLSSTQLNATASTAGTFSYTPAAGAILSAGQHQLSAIFAPTDTANYQNATSSVSLSINKAPLIIGANNASRVYGATNPVFSGTMNGAVNGDALNQTFSTTATISSPAGIYAIVPSASGTNLPNYSVTANNGVLTILPAPTTTTFTLSNQNLTLTATVASTSSGTPTGSVTFYAGQTQLGTGTLSGGAASIALTSFPSGNVSLSAQYAGDANFATSTSASVPVLTLTAASTSLTVPTAGTVTDNLSVSVPSGYAGTVQFSCTGQPQNTTCSFQPASVAFSAGTTAASTTLTLTTGQTARMDSPSIGNTEAHTLRWAVMLALPGLLPLLIRRQRLNVLLRGMSLLFLLCSASICLNGCGGSSSSKSSSTVTPSGSYTIQVMASGPSGVSQSTAVVVTVR